jgi:FixJ family two-component response regulator
VNNQLRQVFIVDDEAEIRVSLSRLLTAAGYEAHSFDSAESFLAAHETETPACLLLDISMPGMSGLALQEALVESQCAHPIVFLTGRGDVASSVRAMRAGAVDYLTKPVDRMLLFAAVDRALGLDAAERRTAAIRRAIAARVESLTRRERQVLEHVVRGRLNKQIAADLGTGEKTVKVHRGRVMSKMGARSVAELVQLAARVGVAMTPFLRRPGPLA